MSFIFQYIQINLKFYLSVTYWIQKFFIFCLIILTKVLRSKVWGQYILIEFNIFILGFLNMIFNKIIFQYNHLYVKTIWPYKKWKRGNLFKALGSFVTPASYKLLDIGCKLQALNRIKCQRIFLELLLLENLRRM